MLPPVTLGHPQHVGAVVYVLPPHGGVVADERGFTLVDQHTGGAGGGVHLQYLVALVAALIVLEREGAAVRAPLRPSQVVRMRQQRGIKTKLLLALHREERRQLAITRIAWLFVESRGQLGLDLIRWRRFNVRNHAAIAGSYAKRRQFLGIRRPSDRAECVGVAFHAIVAQHDQLGGANGPYGNVVIDHQGFRRAVGGAHGSRGAIPIAWARGRGRGGGGGNSSSGARTGVDHEIAAVPTGVAIECEGRDINGHAHVRGGGREG